MNKHLALATLLAPIALHSSAPAATTAVAATPPTAASAAQAAPTQRMSLEERIAARHAQEKQDLENPVISPIASINKYIIEQATLAAGGDAVEAKRQLVYARQFFSQQDYYCQQAFKLLAKGDAQGARGKLRECVYGPDLPPFLAAMDDIIVSERLSLLSKQKHADAYKLFTQAAALWNFTVTVPVFVSTDDKDGGLWGSHVIIIGPALLEKAFSNSAEFTDKVTDFIWKARYQAAKAACVFGQALMELDHDPKAPMEGLRTKLNIARDQRKLLMNITHNSDGTSKSEEEVEAGFKKLETAIEANKAAAGSQGPELPAWMATLGPKEDILKILADQRAYAIKNGQAQIAKLSEQIKNAYCCNDEEHTRWEEGERHLATMRAHAGAVIKELYKTGKTDFTQDFIERWTKAVADLPNTRLVDDYRRNTISYVRKTQLKRLSPELLQKAATVLQTLGFTVGTGKDEVTLISMDLQNPQTCALCWDNVIGITPSANNGPLLQLQASVTKAAPGFVMKLHSADIVNRLAQASYRKEVSSKALPVYKELKHTISTAELAFLMSSPYVDGLPLTVHNDPASADHETLRAQIADLIRRELAQRKLTASAATTATASTAAPK